MFRSYLMSILKNLVFQFCANPRARRASPRSSLQVAGGQQLERRDMLSATVVTFDTGVTAVSQGYDVPSDTTFIVGEMMMTDGEAQQILATSQGLGDFTEVELADLPGASETVVRGISADGGRIAGVASDASGENTEGLIWNSESPSSVTGIGFLSEAAPRSLAVAAFRNGVVGDHAGGAAAVTYSEDNGLSSLEDGLLDISVALAVSLDGSIVAGFSSAFRTGGSAVYWDSQGIHELENSTDTTSSVYSISPDGQYIGGSQDFLELIPFAAGEQASVWQKVGDNYEQTLLTYEDGSRVVGRVVGATDSGYALVSLTDGGAAIYHDSFGTISLGDFVEQHADGADIPTLADVPVGIADIEDGVIQIACQTMLIRVDMGNDDGGFEIIEGSDSADSLFRRVTDGEKLQFDLGAGNDRVTLFIDGNDAEIVINGDEGNDRLTIINRGTNNRITVVGGDGNERLYVSSRGVGLSVDATLGGGNDSFTFSASDASANKVYVDAGLGNDRVSNFVRRNSDDVVFGADLGEGRDRFFSTVTDSDNSSVAVRGDDGNKRVYISNRNADGFVHAVNLGEGNHFVSNSASNSSNGLNAVVLGAGFSRVYDFSRNSNDIIGLYVLDEGRSRFLGYAYRSENVQHEVASSNNRNSVRGFYPRSTESGLTKVDDKTELSQDPLQLLDDVFADLGK